MDGFRIPEAPYHGGIYRHYACGPASGWINVRVARDSARTETGRGQIELSVPVTGTVPHTIVSGTTESIDTDFLFATNDRTHGRQRFGTG